MTKPTVVLYFDDEGELKVLTTGEVSVITVDDRTPEDRTYLHRKSEDAALIRVLLAGEPIGHEHDAKHGEAIRNLGLLN